MTHLRSPTRHCNATVHVPAHVTHWAELRQPSVPVVAASKQVHQQRQRFAQVLKCLVQSTLCRPGLAGLFENIFCSGKAACRPAGCAVHAVVPSGRCVAVRCGAHARRYGICCRPSCDGKHTGCAARGATCWRGRALSLKRLHGGSARRDSDAQHLIDHSMKCPYRRWQAREMMEPSGLSCQCPCMHSSRGICSTVQS